MTRTEATEKIANNIWLVRKGADFEEYGNAESDWKTAEGILSFFDEYFGEGVVGIPEWAIAGMLEDYKDYLPIYKEIYG